MEATRWSRRPLPVNDRRTRPGIWRRARNRARTATHRSDDRGGAISLWVVLMTPVSAFAAVVAMAGPQRLAAESTMQDAADDLAMFAVAWRDGHNTPTGQLRAFPPECAARTDQENTDLTALVGDIATLDGLDPDDPDDAAAFAMLIGPLNDRLNEQRELFGMQLPLLPAADAVELRTQFDALVMQLADWERACEMLSDALVRDLGYLGVDVGSLRGFYSDSLTESAMTRSCSDPQHTTQTACATAGAVWTPAAPGFDLPCRTTDAISGQEVVVVHDAVHVALTGRWQDAGWAAAQVWPDGMPMAAESMGRMSRRDGAGTAPECEEQLVVFNEQGQPVWAGAEPAPDSRKLAQSVGRTPLSG